MIATLLLAHLLAAVVAPFLIRWVGPRAFYALALVPAASAVWAALRERLTALLAEGSPEKDKVKPHLVAQCPRSVFGRRRARAGGKAPLSISGRACDR